MANGVQLSQFTHIALDEDDFNASDCDEDRLSLCEDDLTSGQSLDHNDQSDLTFGRSPTGSDNAEVGYNITNGNKNVDIPTISSMQDVFSWDISSPRGATPPKQHNSPPALRDVGNINPKDQQDNAFLISAESYFPCLSSKTSTTSTNGSHPASYQGYDVGQKKRQIAWRGPRHTSGGSNGSSEGCWTSRDGRSSSIDGLLFEIYDRWQRDSFDSDTFTECSSTSDAFLGRVDSVHHHLEEKHGSRLSRATLLNKGLSELKETVGDLRRHVAVLSARLIRELKRRDRRLAKVNKQCDIVTAILQASSLKRRIDSKLRFSIDPLPGEDAFDQWRDAMRAVARLPQGIPPEFRKKVWLTLADKYLNTLKIDWDKTKRFAFNERTNPDDNKLGLQIVKDLHRTGCSGFSGHDNDQERALLKRVLLAYARWNKQVGYCQGFNVLAAVILGVTDRKEDDALKVMIYLIDAVLPSSYFDNNLRALSVDMAVFRDLLDVHNPELSKHLTHLQTAARDHITGGQYEPPLTNVFTMQWFLTLFATCLRQDTVLRVWDCVLLEGSEILLRASMAIWDRLRERIQEVSSADEFYSTMGVLTQEMLDTSLIDGDGLVKSIYQMGSFPLPQLQDLREKYTYNITPFSAAISTGGGRRRGGATGIFSDDDDLEEEEMMENIGCFTGMLAGGSPTRNKPLSESDRSASHYDISKVSPGAYAANPEHLTLATAYADRINLDLYSLKQQYRKVRQRQKQAHVIITAANARHQAKRNRVKSKTAVVVKTQSPPVQSSVAINHLFLGRDLRSRKTKQNSTTTANAPQVVATYASGGIPGGYNTATPQTDRGHTPRRGTGSRSEVQGRLQKTISLQSVESEMSATSEVTKKSLSSSSSDVSTVCGELDEVFVNTNEGLCLPSPVSDHQVTQRMGQTSRMANTEEHSESQRNMQISKQNGHCDHVTDMENETDKDMVNNEGNSRSKDDVNSETGEVISTEDQKRVANEGSHNKSLPHNDNKTTHNNIINQNMHTCSDDSAITQKCPEDKLTFHQEVTSTSASRPTLLVLSQQSSSGSESVSSPDSSSTSSNHAVVGVESNAPKGSHVNVQDKDSPSSRPAATSHANYNLKTSARTHTISTSSSSSGSNEENHPPFHRPSQLLLQKAPKVFNPFPNQHKNTRRTQQGVKLGLYSRDYIPQLEVGMITGRQSKVVDRSHLNMCVHRQYMEEVRQQGRQMKH